LFNWLKSSDTPFDKWVKSLPRQSKDDFDFIQRFLKKPDLEIFDRDPKIKLEKFKPFINLTADSLIYLPAGSITTLRKKDKDEYYSDNSIIEISLYLLFISSLLGWHRQSLHDAIRKRFFSTLLTITNYDYNKIYDGRISIYESESENTIVKRLSAFLQDTKVRKAITYHETSESMLLDFDIYAVMRFEIYLVEVIPILMEQTRKKFSDWFYRYLNM
jgi:hypothetical protein